MAKPNDTPGGGHLVQVSIDGASKDIQSRTYEVSKLKAELGVDATRELEQVIDGQLKLLADADKVHVKGGEFFVSHVRTGGSS